VYSSILMERKVCLQNELLSVDCAIILRFGLCLSVTISCGFDSGAENVVLLDSAS